MLLKIIITRMPNAKLNKWISFRLQQIGLEYVRCPCASLPIKKKYLKNQSECNTLGKKVMEEEVCERDFVKSSVSALTP